MTVGVRNTGLSSNVNMGVPLNPMHCEVVTPSNSVIFPESVFLIVLAAGDVTVTPAGGGADIVRTIAAGQLPFVLEFMCRAVKATGTTSALIHAVW